VLAIEDERFYSHFGLDLVSIGRAIVRNLLEMRLAQGGSTLTQQLAKNLFLSPKKTFSRKLLEVPTALSLERHLSKDQLLELYLNEVYLGQEGSVAIHGMPEAASAFFGKKLEDLRVDEAATLAGIIKAPSYFNPRRFPERAKERRDTVLRKMVDVGFISEAQAQVAQKYALQTVEQQEHRRLAPFFTAAVEAELSEVIDVDAASSSGLSVYTALDLGMQRCAEQAVRSGAETIEKSNPKLAKKERAVEIALVAIEPYSGLVKAWVGGRDFSLSQFNRVSQSQRQIGSTIKPFLYLTALDGSLNSYKVATAASILEDKPMEIRSKGMKTWNPENFDHDFRGDVTLRYALENSLNMPALYIAERVGLGAVAKTLQAFRIATNVQALPSLALGALDTSLLRLTSAYGALANGGVYIAPRLYVAATDADNQRLSAPKIVEKQVADEDATYVLTNILQGVITRGTAQSVKRTGFNGAAAGKTGTSDSARDAWFVGFTPNLVAGVWVGFDDNSPLGLTGGGAAAPVWGEFMKCSQAFVADAGFIPPQGVEIVRMDSGTGLPAGENCPSESVTDEVFVRGTAPSRRCLHDQSQPSEQHQSDPDNPPSRGGFWSSFFN
jgi:penicillin-binding protein 1B